MLVHIFSQSNDMIIIFGLQCVLQRIGNWRFNAFTLETVTGGKYIFTNLDDPVVYKDDCQQHYLCTCISHTQ